MFKKRVIKIRISKIWRVFLAGLFAFCFLLPIGGNYLTNPGTNNDPIPKVFPDVSEVTFNPNVFHFKWGSEGSGDGQFESPTGIAINASGHIYVVDSNNDRVQVFTSNGTFLFKWGSLGSDDGQFDNPTSITINASGYVYVTESGNDRVQVFTQTGQFVTKWGSYGTGDGYFRDPSGIAINSTGHVYVAEYTNDRVQIFTQTGQLVGKFGSYGFNDGEFIWLDDIAINASGCVYAADAFNNRVQVFSPDGLFLFKWGSSGSGDGEFSIPRSIAINASNEVYVLDSGNNRTQVFTQTGQFMTKWGSTGAGDGEFYNPNSIAINVTGFGYVYVTDTANDRVQAFGNHISPPTNVILGPGSPKTTDDLTFTYEFADIDGDLPQGLLVRWFRNNINQPQVTNQIVLSAVWTNKSDQWNVSVQVFDGSEYSPANWSQVVTIQNTAPLVNHVVILPSNPKTTVPLFVSYECWDPDDDLLYWAPEIRWYKNSIMQGALNDLREVPTSVLVPGDQWYATVRIFDGELWASNFSGPIMIGNEQPSVLFSVGSLQYVTGGTGNLIKWIPVDTTVNSPTYTIYKDGNPIIEDVAWVSGQMIVLSIDSLSPGLYNYTLVLEDGYGARITDTIFVSVTPSENWWLFPLITIVGAAIAAFLGSYFERRLNRPRSSR